MCVVCMCGVCVWCVCVVCVVCVCGVWCVVCGVCWPHHMTCRILVPQAGIEPMPPALEAWSLDHGAASKVPE